VLIGRNQSMTVRNSPRRLVMGKFSFDNYRSQWPRVGAVTALAVTAITALGEQVHLDRSDYFKGALATVTFAVIGIAGPILVGRNKNSPHAFSEAQMGPHGRSWI